jgi:hypothetical protein
MRHPFASWPMPPGPVGGSGSFGVIVDDSRGMGISERPLHGDFHGDFMVYRKGWWAEW